MPRVVLVNGLPGAGKTTLARALAAELRLPLFGKDVVKETLFDWIGTGDRAWSARLGAASMETIWSLLTDCGSDAVVENWISAQAAAPTRAGLARAGATDVLEIFCDVPFAEALRRFAERAPDRHPGHVEHEVVANYRARWAGAGHPLGLGPVLRVPTDRPVDLPAVLAWIRREWDDRRHADGLAAPREREAESGPLSDEERASVRAAFAEADATIPPSATGDR